MIYIAIKHGIVWIYKQSNEVWVVIFNMLSQVKANINWKKQFVIEIINTMLYCRYV